MVRLRFWTKLRIEIFSRFSWSVGLAVVIILVLFFDILAGCYLCCHPDRKCNVEKRELLGLNVSLASTPPGLE